MTELGDAVELIFAALVFILFLPAITELLALTSFPVPFTISASQIVGVVKLLIFLYIGILFLGLIVKIVEGGPSR